MLVLACDRCAECDAPGLVCIRCKSDKLAEHSIDGLRAGLLVLEKEIEALKGRKNQSKRQQCKRRLDALRVRIAELE